jgi:hypothetical protein
MIVNPWAPRCFGLKKALINVIFTSNTNFRKVHQRWPVDSLVRRGTTRHRSGRERLILIEWRVTASQLKACLPISSNTRGLAMATSKEIDKWKRLIGGRDRQVKKIDRNWDSLCTAMKLRSKEDLSSRATYIPPPTQFKLQFAATTNWIDSNLTLYEFELNWPTFNSIQFKALNCTKHCSWVFWGMRYPYEIPIHEALYDFEFHIYFRDTLIFDSLINNRQAGGEVRCFLYTYNHCSDLHGLCHRQQMAGIMGVIPAVVRFWNSFILSCFSKTSSFDGINGEEIDTWPPSLSPLFDIGEDKDLVFLGVTLPLV